MVNWSKSGKLVHLVGITIRNMADRLPTNRLNQPDHLYLLRLFPLPQHVTPHNVSETLLRVFPVHLKKGSVPYAVWCRVLTMGRPK
jgi:hypothetical protein